jgi:tetratricopeptide (TPR) repeat protein
MRQNRLDEESRMMDESTLTCPYCGSSVPDNATVCPDCQEDLAGLAHLHYGPAIVYNQALALARDGKLDEARTKLLFAIEQREGFVPAHVLLAKVYAQDGCWPLARASAARAQALRPDDPALAELGVTLEQAEEAARARRQAEQQEVERERKARAEGYFATYKRDMLSALGAGIGIASFLALILGRLLGGKKHRS